MLRQEDASRVRSPLRSPLSDVAAHVGALRSAAQTAERRAMEMGNDPSAADLQPRGSTGTDRAQRQRAVAAAVTAAQTNEALRGSARRTLSGSPRAVPTSTSPPINGAMGGRQGRSGLSMSTPGSQQRSQQQQRFQAPNGMDGSTPSTNAMINKTIAAAEQLLEGAHSDLSAARLAARERIEELGQTQRQLQMAMEENDNMRKEIDRLRGKMQQDSQMTQDHVRSLQDEVSQRVMTAEAESQRVATLCSRISQDRDSLVQRLERTERALKSTEDKLHLAEAGKVEMQEQVQRAESARAAAEQKMEETQGYIRTLENAQEEFRSRFEELEDAKKSGTRQMSQYRSDMAARLTDANNRCLELQTKNSELEAALRQAERDFERYKERVADNQLREASAAAEMGTGVGRASLTHSQPRVRGTSRSPYNSSGPAATSPITKPASRYGNRAPRTWTLYDDEEEEEEEQLQQHQHQHQYGFDAPQQQQPQQQQPFRQHSAGGVGGGMEAMDMNSSYWTWEPSQAGVDIPPRQGATSNGALRNAQSARNTTDTVHTDDAEPVEYIQPADRLNVAGARASPQAGAAQDPSMGHIQPGTGEDAVGVGNVYTQNFEMSNTASSRYGAAPAQIEIADHDQTAMKLAAHSPHDPAAAAAVPDRDRLRTPGRRAPSPPTRRGIAGVSARGGSHLESKQPQAGPGTPDSITTPGGTTMRRVAPHHAYMAPVSTTTTTTTMVVVDDRNVRDPSMHRRDSDFADDGMAGYLREDASSPSDPSSPAQQPVETDVNFGMHSYNAGVESPSDSDDDRPASGLERRLSGMSGPGSTGTRTSPGGGGTQPHSVIAVNSPTATSTQPVDLTLGDPIEAPQPDLTPGVNGSGSGSGRNAMSLL